MIDIHLALDALLVFIILLFVPIGLWRGAAREAMVAAGIMLGAALAGAWARPWGDDLAARTAFEPPTARFAVAVAALALSTVCLGYGGGAAWRGEQPGTFGRLVGGLLAAFNGVLLLGFALTFLDRYLLEGEPRSVIADGRVARVLLMQFGWLLLGGAVVLFGLVAVGLLFNTLRGNTGMAPVFPSAHISATATSTRRRPPRVRSRSDADKSEPVWDDDSDVDRFGNEPPQRTASERHLFDEDRFQAPELTDEVGPARYDETVPPRRDSGAWQVAPGSAAANEWLRRTAAMSRPLESGADTSAGSATPDRKATSPRRSFTDEAAADRTPGFSIVDLGEVRRSHRSQWRTDDASVTGSAKPHGGDGGQRRFSSLPFDRSAIGSVENGGREVDHGRRCSTCSAPLGARDTFCSTCGAET